MSCNVCSMCGGTATTPNYAKQVDPPPQAYGTILGDSPSRDNRRMQSGCIPPVQVCVPTFAGYPPPNPGRHNPGQQPCIVKVPYDPVKPCPKFICEPCPPPPPTKLWLIKSSPVPQKVGFNRLLMFLLSCCLPVYGSGNEGNCPPPAKVMVCLPCPSPVISPTTRPKKVCGKDMSFPFGVPQKVESCMDSEHHSSSAGKYLPPPQRRICPPHCIHISDLKGSRSCTWHEGAPCLAHCFDTPLRGGN